MFTERLSDIQIDTIKLIKYSNIIAKDLYYRETNTIQINTIKLVKCSNIIAKDPYIYGETIRHRDRYK